MAQSTLSPKSIKPKEWGFDQQPLHLATSKRETSSMRSPGVPEPDLLQRHNNVFRLIFAEDGLKNYVKDWSFIEQFLIARLWDKVLATQNSDLLALYEEVTSSRAVEFSTEYQASSDLPVLCMTFEKDSMRASFFSTIATLGTSLDLTAQELRIELFYPADGGTRQLFT